MTSHIVQAPKDTRFVLSLATDEDNMAFPLATMADVISRLSEAMADAFKSKYATQPPRILTLRDFDEVCAVHCLDIEYTLTEIGGDTTSAAYMDEVVSCHAPRWAWDTLKTVMAGEDVMAEDHHNALVAFNFCSANQEVTSCSKERALEAIEIH